ncbi:MAG: hypothetical protein ACOYM3_12335, partial [Terrimicrobiaceae bacterium]
YIPPTHDTSGVISFESIRILGLRGGTLAKHWFFESSREEVFQYAIRDLQSHSEEYIRFFREN